MQTTSTLPANVAADFERFDKVLAPYTFTIEGDTYLTADAPSDVVATYRNFVTMCAANGWAA